ncbi:MULTISPECIES: ribonuclease III [Rhodobacterales]|uniref:ribonuclease III n=1 Tax=Roseobacter sp. N2S TaxID=2663844 RepID=UPI002863DE67|nr:MULTISPECIES: ribonuclease III [Rhodobacterales]MDR6267234.1 ribonuclease-3 [Roseobacter sp. N2S]
MKLAAELREFSVRLGHDFSDPEVLIQAVTHSSLSSATRSDNQRLEFLGDRVLGLVIAEALSDRDPTASEGLMAPRFNALVRKETCADIARDLDLGAALKMGRSEMISGGRRKQAILADAMEAVIAAVYRDAGFDVARALILRLWDSRIDAAKDDARDAKTTLQEWAQARGMKPPQYVEVGRTGPDHAPMFEIEAQLSNGLSGQGSAESKRNAQQEAAKAVLAQLETEND